VEYREGKSKLSGEKTSAEGCIYCNNELNQLVEKSHAVLLKARRGGGAGGRGGSRSRGGGRGRGRGGRGGRKAPKDKMSQLAAYFV